MFFLVLTLSGCSLSRDIPFSSDYRARQTFVKGLDEWEQEKSTETLAGLSEKYPDSTWAAHADSLAANLASLQNQEKKVANLLKENKKLARDAERYSAENKKLIEENKRMQLEIAELNKNIDKLKQLMVDFELRAK